ncbi:MAG TPA: glycerol-3-phosphate 1-O-acyltransferase PlsY [Candidatus Acidoferrum sp.]
MAAPNTSLALAAMLLAYLLGSIPFGVILATFLGGKDIRKSGSGNIGATNVARVVGPLAGALTLVFDIAKGAGAVLLAEKFSNGSARWMMIAGIAALVGHCFPVWLKGKGGKGVATAAGVFLVLSPPACLAAVVVFLLVVIFSRYVSLGSVSAAAAMPLLIYLLWAPRHAPLSVTAGALAAGLLILYQHRGNLQRLLAGAEPKFSLSKNKEKE